MRSLTILLSLLSLLSTTTISFAKPAKYKGKTAAVSLQKAIVKKSLKDIKKLIKIGVDVNAKDSRGISAALFAVIRDNSEILTYLYSQGADLGDSDNDLGLNSLHYAIKKNKLAIFKLLLDLDPLLVEVETAQGHSPLIMATLLKKNEMVKELLTRGANPNKSDSGGRFALNWALLKENLIAASMLVEKGADTFCLVDISFMKSLKKKKILKETMPVIHKLQKQSLTQKLAPLPESIKLLQLLRPLQKKKTILPATIQALVKKDFPTFVKSLGSTNCADITYGPIDLFSISLILDTVKYSLHCLNNDKEKLIALNKKRFYLNSSLTSQSPGFTMKLISAGFDINNKNHMGIPLLHAAISLHRYGIARKILKNPAIKINQLDDTTKSSALTSAYIIKNYWMMKKLLEAGIDSNICDKDLISPLMIALIKKDHHFLKLLLKHGAKKDIPCQKVKIQEILKKRGSTPFMDYLLTQQ